MIYLKKKGSVVFCRNDVEAVPQAPGFKVLDQSTLLPIVVLSDGPDDCRAVRELLKVTGRGALGEVCSVRGEKERAPVLHTTMSDKQTQVLSYWGRLVK